MSDYCHQSTFSWHSTFKGRVSRNTVTFFRFHKNSRLLSSQTTRVPIVMYAQFADTVSCMRSSLIRCSRNSGLYGETHFANFDIKSVTLRYIIISWNCPFKGEGYRAEHLVGVGSSPQSRSPNAIQPFLPCFHQGIFLRTDLFHTALNISTGSAAGECNPETSLHSWQIF